MKPRESVYLEVTVNKLNRLNGKWHVYKIALFVCPYDNRM